MPQTLALINKLKNEHAIIRDKIDRISDLSEDLEILADIKDKSQDLTRYQYSFLNERRISLRQNLAQFREGLELHYRVEEKVLQPFLGDPARQVLQTQHGGMLMKLSEMAELLLNLSPVGILFNGSYFKHKINGFCLTISSLSSVEDSLLEIAGMYHC